MEPGQELGLQLKAEERDVRILSIREGLIQDWNRASSAETKVQASSRIISANRISTSGKAILDVIESSDTLDLISLSWRELWLEESSDVADISVGE